VSAEGFPPALRLGGREVPLRVERHPRARRMCLRICPASGTIRLTLPRQASSSAAEAFLATHHDWMLRSIERSMAAPRPFVVGADIPFAGEVLRIVEGHGRAIARDGELLRVPGPDWRVNARVALWLRREAQALLEAETRALAATLGRPVARVAVSDPRSRWGSCSTSGTISFSWRLILAPPFVRRAVVAHEVAHLAEPHHGPAFWRLAQALLGAPHTPARQWLRAHGPALHRWGQTG